VKLTGFFESLALAVLCTVVVLIGSKFGLYEEIELNTLDIRSRQFADPSEANPDIVIAAIDESSLRSMKKNGHTWKWPRNYYGFLVDYLHRAGAKTVVFDVIFADPDIDRLETDAEETDGPFAESMRRAENVLLAAQLLHDEDLTQALNPLDPGLEFPSLLLPPSLSIGQRPSAVLPIPLFQQSAAGLGAVAYDPDQDGIYRRLEPFVEYGGKNFPHLGIAAYVRAHNIKLVRYTETGNLQLGDLDVPLDKDGRFLLYWYGHGGPNGVFKYYPIDELFLSGQYLKAGREPVIPTSAFKGKTVIVGTNAPGLLDMRTTPFTATEPYPGMEIYATMLSNLMNEDFLVRANNSWIVVAVFLFSLFIFLSFLTFHSIRLAVLVSMLCGGGWLAVTAIAYLEAQVWIDFVPPEISVILSFAVAAAVSYWREGKARKQLRTMFGRYLSPVVIAEVVEKSEEIELGGKEIIGTVFFSDVKGFTEISEAMTPKDLVLMLNEYFSLATEALLRHDALVDKYIGDAIMAVFGTPLPSDRQQEQACLAAVEMKRVLSAYFDGVNSEHPILITRIGIHTGPMIVGNIGSQLRADYTVIGDTVNLASRLEGVNKVYGTEILVSETTLNSTRDRFLARELDRVRVKGKTEPVNVFELIEDIEHASDLQKKVVENYDEGLKWYRDSNFNNAMNFFEKVLQLDPEDGPTLYHLKRCRSFANTPPTKDWDGVNKLDTK